MDLRVIKTKMVLKKALLELAEERSFNRITVTELSKRAVINKATFYLHYRNIYDLIEEIEADFIDEIISGMERLDFFNTDVDAFLDLVETVFNKRRDFIEIWIKNNRMALLTEKIVSMLRNKRIEENRSVHYDEELEVVLTLLLRGVIDPEVYRDFNYSPKLFTYFKELIRLNSNYYKNKSINGYGAYTVKKEN